MKTSMAEANYYVCPICDDQLTLDRQGRGFVRHKTKADCHHGAKQRDAGAPSSAPGRYITRNG